MRALYLEEIPSEDSIELKGDVIHHLLVVRVQAGEEILLLDGKGARVQTVVDAVGKKSLRLKMKNRDRLLRESPYDLVLVIPKKEALELCLKEATELGFGKIYLVRGEYSQIKVPDSDRLQKILISALEQSNAPYLPEVEEANLSEIPWAEYETATWLDSQSSVASAQSGASVKKMILIVGPEAGFSPAERDFFLNLTNLEQVHLPTPILRSPTALAAGAGLLLQRLLDKKRYEILGQERKK